MEPHSLESCIACMIVSTLTDVFVIEVGLLYNLSIGFNKLCNLTSTIDLGPSY